MAECIRREVVLKTKNQEKLVRELINSGHWESKPFTMFTLTCAESELRVLLDDEDTVIEFITGSDALLKAVLVGGIRFEIV